MSSESLSSCMLFFNRINLFQVFFCMIPSQLFGHHDFPEPPAHRFVYLDLENYHNHLCQSYRRGFVLSWLHDHTENP